MTVSVPRPTASAERPQLFSHCASERRKSGACNSSTPGRLVL
ncbi:hypothetical protein RHECNPAF_2940060 [Rhizobium etli CNPAF512]|nr:hypothetical protein RHECNPAF_2940060 [Rhizobium etli CNPAF512]